MAVLLSLSWYHGCRTPGHAQLRSCTTAVRSRLIKWRFSCGIGTEATRFVAVARRSVALCCVRWRSNTMYARSPVLVGASTPSLTLTGGSPTILGAHTRYNEKAACSVDIIISFHSNYAQRKKQNVFSSPSFNKLAIVAIWYVSNIPDILIFQNCQIIFKYVRTYENLWCFLQGSSSNTIYIQI